MSGINATTEGLPPAEFFIFWIFFSCLCIIIGIFGNVGVIAYNIFMNHSKTPTTYFLVNLAISDIIVCLTFFPPWVFEFTSILTEKANDRKLICKIRVTSSYTSIALSVGNLLAMTIDRCLFITKPLKYPRIMTWKRAYILLAVMWVLAIVNANFVFSNVVDAPEIRCTLGKSTGRIIGICYFGIPIVMIIFLNYKIFNVAKIQRRKIRESCPGQEGEATKNTAGRRGHLQQIKVIKTFAIVLGALLFCLLPRLIISIVNHYFCPSFCIPTSVIISAAMIMGANAVMNPLIYSAQNKEYRNAFLKFITGLFRNN
jgi:uncharacterized protein YacL